MVRWNCLVLVSSGSYPVPAAPDRSAVPGAGRRVAVTSALLPGRAGITVHKACDDRCFPDGLYRHYDWVHQAHHLVSIQIHAVIGRVAALYSAPRAVPLSVSGSVAEIGAPSGLLPPVVESLGLPL